MRAPTSTVGRQWGVADVRAGHLRSYDGNGAIPETLPRRPIAEPSQQLCGQLTASMKGKMRGRENG